MCLAGLTSGSEPSVCACARAHVRRVASEVNTTVENIGARRLRAPGVIFVMRARTLRPHTEFLLEVKRDVTTFCTRFLGKPSFFWVENARFLMVPFTSDSQSYSGDTISLDLQKGLLSRVVIRLLLSLFFCGWHTLPPSYCTSIESKLRRTHGLGQRASGAVCGPAFAISCA